ncbi:MAG TPA: hypothetical protein VFB06_34355 [Streptosporangiaceae bacterium]|nr:hypothetical protein [Streptosporangiaceae bacterium]
MVENQASYGGGLRLTEDAMIDELGFDQVASILGRFHELLQDIRAVNS